MKRKANTCRLIGFIMVLATILLLYANDLTPIRAALAAQAFAIAMTMFCAAAMWDMKAEIDDLRSEILKTKGKE